MDSHLQIPGSGRDVEALACNPTAWVKAAEDHPHAPLVRNCRGKGTTRSSLGCPPASKGIQTCTLRALGGPYSLPQGKKEDSLQWEEENHLLHNLKFGEILEVITYSWILPHHFPSHPVFPPEEWDLYKFAFIHKSRLWTVATNFSSNIIFILTQHWMRIQSVKDFPVLVTGARFCRCMILSAV